MTLRQWWSRRSDSHLPVGPAVWAEVDAADLGDHGMSIDRIYDGELAGMTIRSVFSAEEVSAVVDRLSDFRDQYVDHGSVAMFGTAIVGSEDDRARYHEAAPVMNDDLETLFEGQFRSRIEGVLSQAGGGRDATVPDDGPDRPYVPATVRMLPGDGGVIHAHTGNEFCDVWPAYTHLRSIARLKDSLSYFITAQPAEAGGRLMVYDLSWEDTPEHVLELDMGPDRDPLLASYQEDAIDLGPGDVVLFTGGRLWHRVEPVRGDTPRVTVGGFVAESHDRSPLYYWS